MDLSAAVAEYQRTGRGLTELVERVRRYVYQFPDTNRCGCDGAELLLRIEPRIQTMVDRYQDTGQSFESYLSTSLRWQMRTLAREEARENVRQTALVASGSHLCIESRARIEQELEVHESAGECCTVPRGQGRRLVYMALKLSETLDEDDYIRVANAAGCTSDWLIECWQNLRVLCSERRERKACYRERRDRAWFRVRCIEYRLQLVLEEDERLQAARQLEKWRRRHLYAVRLLARMRSFPTHAEIASVVGVPKGTIDSNLFYGKQRSENESYREKLANALGNS